MQSPVAAMMPRALIRWAAFFALTSLATAEESIEEMLNSEVVKSKRTDIDVADSDTGSFSEFTKATPSSAHHSASSVEDDADSEGSTADPLSMSALLSSASTKSSIGMANDTVKDWNGKNVDLSDSSQQIVRGMIEAFMHRAQLEDGEVECLENSVGTFTSNLVDVGKDATDAITKLVKDKGKNLVGIVPSLMDAGSRVSRMVSMGTQLARNCVQGDALALLNETGHNMINATYIQQRFLVSGVDIAQCLSDAIVSFEEHHFHKFGTDIGTALRKVLLSNATTGKVGIPEGVPQEEIIEEVTEGVSRGFFGKGMRLRITDKVDPKVNISIDLHECIAGNEMLFKEIWEGAWEFFAKVSANKEQHGLADLFTADPGEGQPAWVTELFTAVMQLPMAISRCGFSPEMYSMLGDAVKSLNKLKFNITMPHMAHGKNKAEIATERMALAVDAWTNWKFKDFGTELGKLLRQLLLLYFPALYSVDASGQLQRNLIEEAAIDTKAITPGSPAPFFVVVGLVLTTMLSLTAVKVMRSVSGLQSIGPASIDLETAEDQDERAGVE